MKIITAFEETFSTTDTPPNAPSKDFNQVLQVLELDLGTALTAFARGAKKALKQLLDANLKGGHSMAESSECLGMTPFWVSSLSVTLVAKQSTSEMALTDMVESFARELTDVADGCHLLMVDPLHAQITKVWEGAYQFSLRQKWVIQPSVKEPA